MVAKYGVVLALVRRQAKPSPRLLLKLLGLSKKDSEADNSSKAVEDGREGKNNINPTNKRKVDSREAVTTVGKALVVKKPCKRKNGSR